MRDYKYYIFDQGNVILDINPQLSLDAFANLIDPAKSGLVSAKDLLGGGDNKFITDFMLGHISTDQFVDYLMPVMKQGVLREQVVSAWDALILDVPEQRKKALLKLRGLGKKTYMLSNTNDEHMRHIIGKCFAGDRSKLECYFDGLFLSNEMHLAKPSSEIFIEMMNQSGINPSEAIFIDDLQQHLDAAVALGFDTLLSTGDYWLTRLF